MGVVMGGDPGEVDVRWTRPAVTGFEDGGRGLKTRGVSSLFESGNHKETDSPPEPLEGMASLAGAWL